VRWILVLSNALPVWIALVLAASPVLSQEPVARPVHWPDATTVVDQVLEGERSVAISTALATCPRENPYGDTVWAALLALDVRRIVSRPEAGMVSGVMPGKVGHPAAGWNGWGGVPAPHRGSRRTAFPTPAGAHTFHTPPEASNEP
jgi:hypothetical protein